MKNITFPLTDSANILCLCHTQKENKFNISAKGCTEKYTPDAPYYGVFVENINFETYADGTEADSKNYISKVDGTIENSMLKYDVEYRTDIANAKFMLPYMMTEVMWLR